MKSSYSGDIVAWSNEQAALLRSGALNDIDIENIAEEILSVGIAEQRELCSRMAVLLAHFLKWKFQPSLRGRSWELTIKEQRRAISRNLKKAPSLKASLIDPEWQDTAWVDAVALATKETGIPRVKFPEENPWAVDKILSEDWLPD